MTARVEAELLVETDGALATFTLNRPERLNAVTLIRPRSSTRLRSRCAGGSRAFLPTSSSS